MPGASHYDRHGHGYSLHRRAEPRIAARIHAALGDARTVVNVGAGAGSNEPEDRYVLAIITVHHWEDVAQGLRELRRVARGPVVVLTLDLDAFGGYWLVADYGPELPTVEHEQFSAPAEIAAALGDARIEPSRCRPAVSVRAAQSVWRRLAPGVESRIVAALSADLASGAWDERHRSLRSQPQYDSTLRLIVAGG